MQAHELRVLVASWEAWKKLERNKFRLSLKEHSTGWELLLNCYVVMLSVKILQIFASNLLFFVWGGASPKNVPWAFLGSCL